jgi:hypothetical protein
VKGCELNHHRSTLGPLHQSEAVLYDVIVDREGHCAGSSTCLARSRAAERMKLLRDWRANLAAASMARRVGRTCFGSLMYTRIAYGLGLSCAFLELMVRTY